MFKFLPGDGYGNRLACYPVQLNSYHYQSVACFFFFFIAYYDDTILFSFSFRFNTFCFLDLPHTPPLRVLIDFMYAAF